MTSKNAIKGVSNRVSGTKMGNSSYKNRNRPNMSENAKWHQGYFKPSKPEKCLSTTNVYRSSWELKFMEWCDRNPLIERWASEPVSVQYKNPVSNLEYCKKNGLNPKDPKNWKLANYWTDFWIELRQKDGTIKKIFIEIKPYSQTQPPKVVNESAPLKEQKRFIREAETYAVNKAKWQAAKTYFNQRGCDFVVFTEKTLEKLGCIQ